MSEPLIVIRAMRESDRRFIEASWFESYFKALRLGFPTPFDVFKSGMNVRIKRLLEESDVYVAVANIDHDEILGYSVVSKDEPKALHWLYVKALFRRQGIATKLLFDADHYSHTPLKEGRHFLKHHGLKFAPELAEP